jgi:hypothetical protein
MIYNIEWIEHESAQLGLSNQRNLLEVFGDQRRAKIEQFFKDWASAKARLQSELPSLDAEITSKNRPSIAKAIMRFLEETREQNASFLKLSVEAYAEEIDTDGGTVIAR